MINRSYQFYTTKLPGVYEIDTVVKLGMGHPGSLYNLLWLLVLMFVLAILNVMYDGFKIKISLTLLVNMVHYR
jgi:3-hydroxybutyryl-CoA dehydrogenase